MKQSKCRFVWSRWCERFANSFEGSWSTAGRLRVSLSCWGFKRCSERQIWFWRYYSGPDGSFRIIIKHKENIYIPQTPIIHLKPFKSLKLPNISFDPRNSRTPWIQSQYYWDPTDSPRTLWFEIRPIRNHHVPIKRCINIF